MKYINIALKSIILIYVIFLTYIFFTTNNTLGHELYLNYSDGYIRRGLVGQITFLLVKNFNLSFDLLDFYSSLIIKIIALTIIIVITYIKKINFFLIFSAPLMIAGFQYSAGAGWTFGNLDFLLITIFLIQIILYNFNKNFILYITLSFVGIFVHEVFFFITILPSFFLLKQDRKKIVAYYIIIFILFAIQGINKGNINQINQINEQWNKIGVYNNQLGVLKGLASNSFNFWWITIKTFPQKIGFILNNLLMIFFITLMAFNNSGDKAKLKKLIAIVFFQNIVFFTLSMIANDYGRWYFLLFTSIIIFFYLTEEKIILKTPKQIDTYVGLLKKVYPFRYFIYFFAGVPFGNWSFHFFTHSLPYVKIVELVEPFF